MIRLMFFLLISYLTYAIYQKYKNHQVESKIENPGKVNMFSKSSCPSPKTFIDYTEGRIKGEKKEAIDRHIAHCKDCQEALNGVFGISTEIDQKRVLG